LTAGAGAGAPTLARLKEYDAVFVWSAGTAFPDTFCDTLADYVDAGGGVIVGAIATNTGTGGIAGRFERENYLSVVRGSQVSSPATLRLPTETKDSRHPVFRHVTRFDGGGGSYRTGVTLRAGATLVGSWSDGTPLISEIEGPRKTAGRKGLSMTLNFYPVSSAINEQYWRRDSDGGLLILNALAYCGQKTVKPKRAGAAAAR